MFQNKIQLIGSFSFSNFYVIEWAQKEVNYKISLRKNCHSTLYTLTSIHIFLENLQNNTFLLETSLHHNEHPTPTTTINPPSLCTTTARLFRTTAIVLEESMTKYISTG